MAISPAKASPNLPPRAMLSDFRYPRTSSPMLYGKGSSLGFVRSYCNYEESSLFSGRPSGLDLPLDLRLHTETLSESFLNKLKTVLPKQCVHKRPRRFSGSAADKTLGIVLKWIPQTAFRQLVYIQLLYHSELN